jgi:Concanavalin A-like lectin/glucanases superfamily
MTKMIMNVLGLWLYGDLMKICVPPSKIRVRMACMELSKAIGLCGKNLEVIVLWSSRMHGERYSKFTKTVSEQYCLVLEDDTYLSTEKKEWHRKEVKEFCFEMWFNTSSSTGNLLYAGDGKIKLYFKDGKISCTVNKQDIPIDTSHEVRRDVWTHIALSLNVKEKSVCVYLDGKAILNKLGVNINIKKLGHDYLAVASQFEGKVTEIRFWKRAKNFEEVKSNMRTPLSVVGDESVMVVINIKKPGNEGPQTIPIGSDIDFDFGDINVIPETRGVDNWNFEAPDEWVNKEQPTDEPRVESKSSVKDQKKESLKSKRELPIQQNNPQSHNSSNFNQETSKIAQTPKALISPPVQIHHPIAPQPIFSGLTFLKSIQILDPIDSQYTSLFASITDQHAFLHGISSLLLNIVKKSRYLYFKDDFESALRLVDRVFELTKDVYDI